MRISTPFGERKQVLPSGNPKRKYFLAYEGSETERRYFDGIRENKAQIGIHALIEILPLLRSHRETGWSHPTRILASLREHLHQMESGCYRISTIVDWIVDYAFKAYDSPPLFSEEALRSHLIRRFEGDGQGLQDTVSDLERTAAQLAAYLQDQIAVKDLRHYLKEQAVTYDAAYDRVCIIVDRDAKSFLANQYDSVVRDCDAQNFQLYVTNPCFEFWLLLHFDAVFTLDPEQLKTNRKITEKHNYAEVELRKLVPGYRKNNIQFPVFHRRIDHAIRNEKSFPEELSALKDNIGSNVGQLITELRSLPLSVPSSRNEDHRKKADT